MTKLSPSTAVASPWCGVDDARMDSASILPNNQASIVSAAELLRQGKLVAFATETVYGLGADALNPEALAAVFEAKGRPRFDPLIVHAADIESAKELVAEWSETARCLAQAFWPGPLTLVLPKKPVVPDLATAGLPTVAIRVPGHDAARALIGAAGTPIAAPSANRFGSVSPTTAQHVATELGDRVAAILDAGPCEKGIESTVVRVAQNVDASENVEVLRLGALAVEQIEQALGQGVKVKQSTDDPGKAAVSPGTLSRHYATRTPLVLIDATNLADHAPSPSQRHGLLCFDEAHRRFACEGWAHVEMLSPKGDTFQAAANLFAAMRRLDAAKLEKIVALPAPTHTLGSAINDRLTRAATQASR